VGALREQEGALRASLQAEYGLRLLRHGGGRVVDIGGRDRTPFEVADLVVHLPAGCALWVATGGPAALSTEAHLLRETIFKLDVIDWHAHDPKGQRPTRIELPARAHERQAEQMQVSAKAAAWAARQRRANGG
jgi:hypothetical protein